MLCMKHITNILIIIHRYYLISMFLTVHNLISSIGINFAQEKTHYISEKRYIATKASLTPKQNIDVH